MSLQTGFWMLLAAVVLVAAFFPARGVRVMAQVVTGALFAVCALATLALIVGGITLESKGGGVMLLFAVFPGIAAWIAGHFFFASRRYSAMRQQPVEDQRRSTIREFEESLDGGMARLARLNAERARLWTSPARRRRLDADIAHEERMLGLLPALRPALDDLANYEQEPRRPGA